MVFSIMEGGIERGWVFRLMAVIAVLDFRGLIAYMGYHLGCDAIDILPETMRELRQMKRAKLLVDLKSACIQLHVLE